MLLLLTSPFAWSQTITLKGMITTDDERPIAQTRISVSGGFGDDTDDQGTFNIQLSKDYISGERVLLNVVKKDWVMNYPLDGEWNLPNIRFQRVHTTRVIMVPKGSKALWTHARIEKLVAQLSDEVTQLKVTNQSLEASATEPQPIDFTYQLAEWAETYGFTPDEVKVAFDEWAEEAQGSTDFRKLGLVLRSIKRTMPKPPATLSKLLSRTRSALKEIEEVAREKRLSAFENWKDAGEALFLSYQFDIALSRFQKAGTLVTKETYANQWAEIHLLIGNAQAELSTRVDGVKAHESLLDSAQSNYCKALAVFAHEALPKQWARTQNSLGILSAQNSLLGRENSLSYREQTRSAYQRALEVFTYEEFPQEWAVIQNNLGVFFSDIGIVTEGPVGLEHLEQALEAFQNALAIRCQDSLLLLDCAGTQNNIGNVSSELGTRLGEELGLPHLKHALNVYQRNLEVFTSEAFPQQWAMTQDNLGTIYFKLCIFECKEDSLYLMHKGMEAYQKAIEVYDSLQLLQDWARTQNNFGNGFRELGIRTEGQVGSDYLQQAADTYMCAMEVLTYKAFPRLWASIQDNLGIAYRASGIRVAGPQGIDYLRLAVIAYRNALKVRTRQELPLKWAQTQSNLAEAYLDLGQNDAAAQAYANCLKVNPAHGMAYNIAIYYFHEVAFDYQQAYDLSKQALKYSGESIYARTHFAEKQFTTARFSNCAQQIQSLLQEQEIHIRNRVALRGILLANAFALGQSEGEAEEQFAALKKEVASQVVDFKVQRPFNGIKNFVSQYEKLAPYRDWLLALFNALNQEDRDAILAALDGLENALPTLARDPR